MLEERERIIMELFAIIKSELIYDKKDKEYRRILEAKEILEGKTTREVQSELGVGRSTVSRDIRKIKFINPWLYKACKDILDYHFFIKYMRGGEGTRKKYKLQNAV